MKIVNEVQSALRRKKTPLNLLLLFLCLYPKSFLLVGFVQYLELPSHHECSC